MQQEKQKKQTILLLHKHLQVEEGEPLARVKAEGEGMEELRELLKAQIAWMLDHQFDRLLQAMYRIDVNEKEFREVLAKGFPVADSLADLVLKRELQKVWLREQYKTGRIETEV